MTIGSSAVHMLQLLWDIEQIKPLKARYFRLLDARDWDGFATLFTPDCMHHLPAAAPQPTLNNAESLASVKVSLGHAVTVHHGHMPEITILGATEAEGIWSMFDDVEYKPPGEAARRFHGYGHYFETYRKDDDGKWRISSKRNVRHRPLDTV